MAVRQAKWLLMQTPHLKSFKPNLRFVADDGREFIDLTAFGEWVDALPAEQRTQIFFRSHLSKKQCKHLWAWLGRTDKAPKALTIHVPLDFAKS